VDCFHGDHQGDICHANDEYWLDPVVGGDPNNEPRECGCLFYVDQEMRGRIEVVTEDHKARAPFTPAQVANIRERQSLTLLHPYTCIAHSTYALSPGLDGLRCPVAGCGFLQDWVHKEDIESRWWVGIDNRP
jgi:hypothetical protein